ncbi:MAG: Xaa-Pro peptidase family protein [Anaerolineaceae bacterium]|nr:Xaa-Pro peptidase family protein [Anaerolineaceae bacterium]
MNDRISKLTQAMQDAGLEMLVLNPGASLTYLTGLHFHVSERPTVLLVSTSKPPQIILAALEANKLKNSSTPLEPIPYDDNPEHWTASFHEARRKLGKAPQTIGVEPTALRFLELNYLQAAFPDTKFISAEDVLSSLRITKDNDEVEKMRKAAKIAQDAFLATLPIIQPGVSELSIAAELSAQLLRHGSQSEFPFPPIVASGPYNSADPHAVPSERRLEPGDLVVIDWGARYQNYCSDITRMVAVGQVSPELQNIANIVKQANAAGRQACKPGVPAGSIDQAARQVIEKAGYGPQFNHRVGHGLGMEAHEPPFMFGENDFLLVPGVTFTVEPGIYVSGTGGVRIEDDLVITADDAESLTTLPRELFVIE